MSLFAILDARALPDLMALFLSDPVAHGIARDEAGLFLDEVAARIAQAGSNGIAFLLDRLEQADEARAHAILLAFGLIDRDAAAALLPRIRFALASYLTSANPRLVAEVVDAISHLGFSDMAGSITPLLKHESPYVVGSALRFLSNHDPSRAQPILIEALRSPEPIVRQNAIDELDELECKDALPSIVGLLNDPDADVRAAAHWAAAHLGGSAV